MSSIAKLCSVEGCNRPYYSRGFCKRHYKRARRRGEIDVKKNEMHGMHGTPEYVARADMIDRCYNPNNKRYDHYGGRGIRICERYRSSFAAFYDDLGDRPDGMTLDRRDTNGHYSCGKCEECEANGWPKNVRWATPSQQTINRRLGKNNTSGFRGVYPAAHRNLKSRWAAKIGSDILKPREVHLGTFDTAEEAANMYDQFAVQIFKKEAHPNFEYFPVPRQ